MKRLFLFAAIGIAAINAIAQDRLGIMVSYRFEHPNYKTGVRDSKNDYILYANAVESKFFSPLTEYVDSMQSTPEGMARLNEISENARSCGDYDGIPHHDGLFYVVKSLADKKLTYYEIVGMNRLYEEEPIQDFNWKISDSTRIVLGYRCSLASVELYGRKWKAWFSPEIPIMDGPWKLSELPGLILESETEDGLYHFTATGIRNTSRPVGTVFLSDRYEKVSRRDLLKSKRAFFDNPLGNISSQASGRIVIQDENGNKISSSGRFFAPREVVDFIETDY